MNVLFVATRFPVPPWRGDQVRAYHHLRVLGARHAITVVALVWRRPSAAERAALAGLGVRLVVEPLGVLGTATSFARLATGDPRPLQVLLYLRQRAQRALARLVADGGYDLVHAQLVRAAPYLPAGPPPGVVDLVDALSTNLARRARADAGPLGWVAGWEARRLARYEQAVMRRAAVSLVVSDAEREALAGGDVRVVPNGVDVEAFPYTDAPRPGARLLFHGNLGYFPNVDAVGWLARDVLPRVRAAVPDAELRLAGDRPARAVRRVAAMPGVSLSAAVPTMVPELAAASVAMVPMRAGSGVQNKVLEAMSSGTPVVTTARVAAALHARAGEHCLVADDAAGLAAAAITLLRDRARGAALARAARALVEARFRWEVSAAGVEAAWDDALAHRRAG